MKINNGYSLLIPAIFICASITFAQNYQVNWNFFSGGFGNSSSNNINLITSLGHNFDGNSDGNGSSINSGDLTIFESGILTGFKDELNILPEAFNLKQNFPNPFNPSTKIEYDIPQNSFVEIKVYDVTGRELNVLVKEEQTAGNYIIEWKPEGIGSGIYFCRITAFPREEHTGGFLSVRKMIFLK
jgi:hypothetical protein